MDRNTSREYIGYGILSDLLRKIYKLIDKLGSRFLKISDRLRFEQFKLVFGQREDDIYIATYPKSGTTLVQMILYQLTTSGDLNFNHIYDVSPWIRNASFRKQAPMELPSPRLIKTHDSHNEIAKGTKGRFIYVYRNGMDVAVSLYHQQKNYNKSDLEFDVFIKSFFKTKDWFKHVKGWFDNKNKFRILYVSYEDLLNNKQIEIERIIDFCRLNPGKEAISRAIECSSFDYMKSCETKFGDQPKERKQVYDQFIRNGKEGEGEEMFSFVQKEEFVKYYSKIVQSSENKVFKKIN
jgi:hypothetical protein